MTLRRVPGYWGRDLPVRRGHNNFDAMRYDWYRDTTVALEAFKAGEYDIRQENQALAWATRYEGPGLERGLYRKEEIAEERTNGMQGFVMNLRREQFRDVRVREALAGLRWHGILSLWLRFAAPLNFTYPMLGLGTGKAPLDAPWAFARDDIAPGVVARRARLFTPAARVFRLVGTELTVQRAQEGHYQVRYLSRDVPGRGHYLVLNTAKQSAYDYMVELIEIGLTP